ncbi:Major Facilitator Superfamily protein [Metarhizium acridum CQMa 102]|uniref:Major Facilitator Superfamily protein n=1 Tax=Metarhizium acridum (strain CQMa 102) TaxID=655827 RepID=E9EF19_METAQ|nr:Major Facilitator Superfamily protein [Metarhizium acridum CQMa 102]EFY85464.1 Major Facilitator Superfamily protein [Metarhizium acridum CQMa 102]
MRVANRIANNRPNVAPPVGPVLGGILTAKLGWKWIFCMLCILGGSCLALILLSLPETSRVIVGNGSIAPKGIYLTLFSVIARNKKGKSSGSHSLDDSTNMALSVEHGPKFTLPNPLNCLKVLLWKDVAVILSCNGIYYMIYCSIKASLSTLFIEIYHYESLGLGLIYMPFGIACLAGTFIWGKVLDFEFARLAKKCGMSQGEVRRNADFPIEAARLSSALYLVVLSTVGTIVYGWVIHYRVHVSVPLVFQAIVGFSTTGLFVELFNLDQLIADYLYVLRVRKLVRERSQAFHDMHFDIAFSVSDFRDMAVIGTGIEKAVQSLYGPRKVT